MSEPRWSRVAVVVNTAARTGARALPLVTSALRRSTDGSVEVHEVAGGTGLVEALETALAAEPELLIMDEPTAGVDAASQEALAGTLAAISSSGTTLVVVTHESAPLAGVLTRAVVVDHGRIAYDGPLAGVAADSGAGDHHHPEDTGLPPARGYRQDQPRVTTDGGR